MSKRRNALIAQIEEAFQNTIHPAGAKITNCTWNCDECAEIAEAFEGKHWSNLKDVRFLRQHETALTFFEPEACRFYLPAFMLVSLRSRANLWSIPERLEWNLTPPETEGDRIEDWKAKFNQTPMDYFLWKVSGFTTEQKQAIRAYLQYYFEMYPENWRPGSNKSAKKHWTSGKPLKASPALLERLWQTFKSLPYNT